MPAHTTAQNGIVDQAQLGMYYNTPKVEAVTVDNETYEDVGPEKSHADPDTGVADYDNALPVCHTESDSADYNYSYDNPPSEEITPEQPNAALYENVQNGRPYEPLQRVEYENTRTLNEHKFYTGLDNSKRHSKV